MQLNLSVRDLPPMQQKSGGFRLLSGLLLLLFSVCCGCGTGGYEKRLNNRSAKLERAEKLKAARDTAAKNKPAKEKAPLQVKKSAAVEQKERPNKDGIQITYGAVKKVLKDGSLPGPYPKVQKIFKAFDDLTMGRINDGQLMNLLAVITGEAKEGTAKKEK